MGYGRAAPALAMPVGAVIRRLILIEFTSGFIQYGMIPLLPRIGERAGISGAALSWVIAVKLLAGAACVPVIGRLGDRYGHRRLLRISVALLAAGTVLVAVAPTFELLLVGRLVQAPMAALLPLEIALVRGALPQAAARRAIALLVGALTFGALVGTVVTGAVETATGSVSLALLVPAAMTVACVPLCLSGIPPSPGNPGVRMDWPGALLLSAGTASLLGGLSQVEEYRGSPAAAGGIGLGLVLIAAFGLVELRTPHPLIDLRAMAQPRALSYYVAAGLFGVVYFGSQAPNSAFLAADPGTDGYGFGLSAFAISLVILPAIVGSIAGSLGSARLASLVGYRACVAGAFTTLAGGFILLVLARDRLPLLCVAMVVLGLGTGVVLGALPTAIVELAPPDRAGIATAVYNNTKLIGGALAGGGCAVLLSRLTPAGTDAPHEAGYLTVWLVAAACAALAAAAVGYRMRAGRSVTS